MVSRKKLRAFSSSRKKPQAAFSPVDSGITKEMQKGLADIPANPMAAMPRAENDPPLKDAEKVGAAIISKYAGWVEKATNLRKDVVASGKASLPSENRTLSPALKKQRTTQASSVPESSTQPFTLPDSPAKATTGAVEPSRVSGSANTILTPSPTISPSLDCLGSSSRPYTSLSAQECRQYSVKAIKILSNTVEQFTRLATEIDQTKDKKIEEQTAEIQRLAAESKRHGDVSRKMQAAQESLKKDLAAALTRLDEASGKNLDLLKKEAEQAARITALEVQDHDSAELINILKGWLLDLKPSLTEQLAGLGGSGAEAAEGGEKEKEAPGVDETAQDGSENLPSSQ